MRDAKNNTQCWPISETMERFTKSKRPPSARYLKSELCHPYKGAPLGLAQRELCRRHTLPAVAILNTWPPTLNYRYHPRPAPPPAPTAAPTAAPPAASPAHAAPAAPLPPAPTPAATAAPPLAPAPPLGPGPVLQVRPAPPPTVAATAATTAATAETVQYH